MQRRKLTPDPYSITCSYVAELAGPMVDRFKNIVTKYQESGGIVNSLPDGCDIDDIILLSNFCSAVNVQKAVFRLSNEHSKNSSDVIFRKLGKLFVTTGNNNHSAIWEEIKNALALLINFQRANHTCNVNDINSAEVKLQDFTIEKGACNFCDYCVHSVIGLTKNIRVYTCREAIQGGPFEQDCEYFESRLLERGQENE